MTFTRRQGLHAAAALALGTSGLPRPARADSGPFHIVVGFAAGGSVDDLGRMVARSLTAATGRPAIVENKTGAAGRIAIEAVTSSEPNGDTLLVTPQGPMTLFTHVFAKLRFDPAKDFSPITRLAVGDFAFSVGPMVPARDLAGFRAWAKGAGSKAAYGSPGAGTLPHFVGVSIAQNLGVTLTHIPYRGSAATMVDLAGGNVAAAVSPVTEALALHKAGKIRILATTGATRSPFVPDVPTFKELGIDLVVPLWFAVYGPAHVPEATVDLLRKAIDTGFATAEVKSRLAQLGLVPAPLSPAALEELRRKETAMWGPVVKASGFKPSD